MKAQTKSACIAARLKSESEPRSLPLLLVMWGKGPLRAKTQERANNFNREGTVPRELPEGITDEMFWGMCDCHMSDPVPLGEADLSRPFVYERRWGVFYVPFGYHQSAMGLLLAWQHGCHKVWQVTERLGIAHDGAADYWLQHTPGAAFRSSVGKRVQVATPKGLTVQERRLFGDVCGVFE